MRGSFAGQRGHALDHRWDATFLLRVFIARMQRGKLDGNAGAAMRSLGAHTADIIDGLRVRFEILLRVGGRARTFAQNIIGQAIAFFLEAMRAGHRVFNILAQHELLAQDAHRLDHRLPDHGLADARQRAA